MTPALHIPARADAPIACDMSTAVEAPEERLQAYHWLFEDGLVRRERRADAVVFVLRAGTHTTVSDLARREAACCPFLDYRVETAGDEVVWTVTNVGAGAAADAILDAFHALPDAVTPGAGRG